MRFYNKRGTAEQWKKEGKQAVKMTRLSCHRFCANEVRLWLSVIAYNLGNLWRRLALPAHVPLQVVVGGKAKGVLNVSRFQRLVQLRLGKGGVAAESHFLALRLLPLDLGQQQFSQPSALWTLPGRSLAARQSPSRLNSSSG